MRHRAQRTLLDRLLPSAPGRRVALAGAGLASVVAATGAGLAMVGDQDPDARPSASADFPQATYPLRTPSGLERSADVSRGAKRPSDSATPSPTPSLPPSPTAPPEESSTPSPTRTAGPSDNGSPTPGSSPSRSATPADVDPPQTTASTSSVDAGSWVLALAADEPASFTCSLDGGAYQPCAETSTFPDLDGGKHTLAARATDEAGNTDPTPVQLTTTVTGPR